MPVARGDRRVEGVGAVFLGVVIIGVALSLLVLARAVGALEGDLTVANAALVRRQLIIVMWADVAFGLMVIAAGVGLASRAITSASDTQTRRFRALVEGSPDFLAILSPDGLLSHAAGALAQDVGPATSAQPGSPFLDLVIDADRSRVRDVIEALATMPGGQRVELSFRLDTAGGAPRHLRGHAINHLEDPAVEGLVISVHDVTDQMVLEEELSRQAFRDSLTGLPNRVLFRDRIDAAVARLVRSRRAPTLLFIDLDDFKAVNDNYGHAVGDGLLQSVANDLRGVLREGDTAARLGGDEFAILLEDNADEEVAGLVAARLQERMAKPRDVLGRELHVLASIGVARGSVGESTEELLRNADIAMYEAKRGRTHGVAIFERTMHEELTRKTRLRSDLEYAIERDELTAVYQPVVDIRTGEVVAWEALLRWSHPFRGVVTPDEFIPMAEETGVIVRLGRWVLNEACMQLASWRRDHPVTAAGHSMNVNVSPVQLRQVGFAEDVLAIVRQAGLPPKALTVEIKETALLKPEDSMVEQLRILQIAGVRIAVDDFGTGYSTLRHLRAFPVDMVKIDKSFMDDLAEGTEGRRVADAIAALARTLGMSVAAEGIEHDEQRDALTAMGCNTAQGYRFAHPMTPGEVGDVLNTTPDCASLASAVLGGRVGAHPEGRGTE